MRASPPRPGPRLRLIHHHFGQPRRARNGAVDRLDLPNIPVSADIVVGDKLVTSGLGGKFPAGFPVGTIASLKADESGMFATATVRPAAALDRSGEVLLLRELAEPVGPPAPAEAVGPPASLAEPAAVKRQ